MALSFFGGTVVGCQICQISTNLWPGNCLCPSRLLWEGVEKRLVIGFGFEGGLREVEGSPGQSGSRGRLRVTRRVSGGGRGGEGPSSQLLKR